MKSRKFGFGIFNIGKFASKINGRPSPAYVAWSEMIKRCYSDKLKERQPEYEGSYASDKFLVFQEFAEWANVQVGFSLPGYQLDKDLIVKGNKKYSESTCVFLPSRINILLTKSNARRGYLPIGVYLSRGKYSSAISIDNRKKFLGRFDNKFDAFNAYKIAKEAEIKRLAFLYKDAISSIAYDSLINYIVEITD